MSAAETAMAQVSPDIPLDQEGPVFREPWEAQAFAIAVALHEKGLFSWSEWAQTLGSVIRHETQKPTGRGYYRLWMIALERITAEKQAISAAELHQRQHEWENAAARTPHGMAITLETKGN
ncbi:MAG: nitrile hydratase accessory protein [Nitratireductor sp.]